MGLNIPYWTALAKAFSLYKIPQDLILQKMKSVCMCACNFFFLFETPISNLSLYSWIHFCKKQNNKKKP